MNQLLVSIFAGLLLLLPAKEMDPLSTVLPELLDLTRLFRELPMIASQFALCCGTGSTVSKLT